MTTSTLDDIAALIGRPGALAIISIWGGGRLYIPRTATPTHPIADVVGELMLERLCARHGGDVLELPLPPTAAARRRRILELEQAGGTTREIAFATGCTERYVRKVLAAEELRKAETRATA
jgi:hypothetical protein